MRHPLLPLLLAAAALTPIAHGQPLLFFDFENTGTMGNISTSVGLSGVAGIGGFASQTGGGPAELFPEGGTVHLTRYFGTFHPYVEFTLTSAAALQSVTFDHQHNHNFGYPTYPGYDVQLQLDRGDGYLDLGAAIRAEGYPDVTPFNGTQSGYVTGTSISLDNLMLDPGTYRLRWDSRNLAYGADTGSEYFALNNVAINGVILPAPGAAAVLAVGGLVVARRRR